MCRKFYKYAKLMLNYELLNGQIIIEFYETRWVLDFYVFYSKNGWKDN